MKYYTVQKGDTLSKIEKKLGIPKAFRQATLKINPIIRDNPDYIRPGWKLKFPTTFEEVKAIATVRKKIPIGYGIETRPEIFPSWMERKLALERKTVERKLKEEQRFKKIQEPAELKKAVLSHYNLASNFKNTIERTPMRKGHSKEIIVTIKKTESKPKISKVEKPFWEGRYHYPGAGKPLVEIVTSLPEVVLHENLHAHFYDKAFSATEFNKAWEKAKKTKLGSKLEEIDKRLLSYSYGGKNLRSMPYSLAQERYAWFGEQLGGIWGIPKYLEDIPEPLREFYKGVIRSRKGKEISPAFRFA